ncbi:MAG: hypothetical protein V1721_01320 [Pseudomonadota bacterium]
MEQDEKRNFGFFSFVKGLFSSRDKSSERESVPVNKNRQAYSPEKQKEIETLCNSLFRQKKLVTSGKLQLIGLGKIKKRMGKGWDGLQPLVYQIVEDVISNYMTRGDIFLRYQDDKYVIIFGNDSCDEGEMKALLIAEEIKSNILAMNKEEMKGFDIEKHVSEVETAILLDKPLHEAVEQLANQGPDIRKREKKEDFKPVVVNPIEIDMDFDETPPPVIEQAQWAAAKKLNCSYAPLWDVQKGAITTYLCHAPRALSGSASLSKDSQDMAMLETVIAELQRMSQEDQKFFIICPVRHETLYRNRGFKKFTALCLHLTPEQKKFLMLMIVDPLENLPKKNAYWFVSPLKGYCNSVSIEVPARQKTDFLYFYQNGFDAIGIKLGKMEAGEPVKIDMMNAFGTQAKNVMISETFVLDISTLSLATSAACAGFRYLGGTAIHEDVPKPDKMYRYKYENLLSGIVFGK